MTLSPEPPMVLRGAALLELPVVTLVSGEVPPAGVGRATTGWLDSDPAPLDENVPSDPEPDEPTLEEQLIESYERGFADGATRAEAEAREAAAPVLASLDAAIEQLAQTKTACTSAVAENAVELALELTALLLRREVLSSTDPGRDAVIRCLDQVPARQHLTVRVNPDDLDRMGSIDELLADRTFDLVPDAGVASGDAMIDFEGATIDGSLTAALQRVSEVLTS